MNPDLTADELRGLRDLGFTDAEIRRQVKDGKRTACPLGEGLVDWGKLFEALARARFTGPISLPVSYRIAA